MAKICSSHGETNTYLILLPHSELIITSKFRTFFFFNSCFAAAAEFRDLESLPSRSHEVPYVLPASRIKKPDSSVTCQNCKQKEMAVLEYSPAWSRCWGALYSIASRQSVEKLWGGWDISWEVTQTFCSSSRWREAKRQNKAAFLSILLR